MKSFAATPLQGTVRIDIEDPLLGNDAKMLAPRFCTVLTLPEARLYAVILMDAITKAETNEAMFKNRRKKK